MAIDRVSGKTLWEQTATTATPHEGYHRIYGSFASNNPATDGRHVYAFFGSQGLFAYDMNGKQIWKRDFNQRMKMRLQFGEGTAVVLHEDKLITVFDHQEQGLLAVTDAATGKEVWSIPRNEGSSWSTPLVVTHQGQKQIVVTATPKAMAYDFETGKLVWEVSGLGLNPIPMPIQSGDVVYVMSGYRDPKLMAIRLGRTGDLTGTDAVLWETTRGLSYTPSPVLHDGILYLLTDNGQLSALEREDRRAALSAAAPAEAVQLQGVAACRERPPLSGVRGRGRHRREDGAVVRGARDQHAGRSVLHRDTGRS